MDRHGSRRPSACVLATRHDEFLNIFIVEGLLAADHPGDQGDLCEMFDGLHLHVRVFKVFAVGHDAVIRHEQGIVLRNEGFQRVGKFGGAGSAVTSQRDTSQANDDLAH
jgi:hypothetical protein